MFTSRDRWQVVAMTPAALTSFAPTAASTTAAPAFPGGATGAPRTVLRLEGLAMMVVAIAAYAHLGASWPMFAALFLAPDLAFLAYLAGPRVGAIAYNTTHSYLTYALVLALGLTLVPAVLPIAALGAAHVGFDRALGYGLKYATAFGHTHLGVVGKR
jgi:hypothetical protein